ncbi:MAG: WYL domain-containing protein, partial [Crocinitomicaceae bacterium]|nr:WYL domain-containing protein [Crocinitomicaceae bacterium]
PFHHSQTLTSNSTQYHEFELTIFITEEFVRSLLGFSSEIEVLSPKSLRDTIKNRVSEMNKIYN